MTLSVSVIDKKNFNYFKKFFYKLKSEMCYMILGYSHFFYYSKVKNFVKNCFCSELLISCLLGHVLCCLSKGSYAVML